MSNLSRTAVLVGTERLLIGVAVALTLILAAQGDAWAGAVYGLVGAIVVVRRPRNRVGWVLVATGLCFVASSYPTPDSWSADGLESYGLLGLPANWTAWVTTAAVIPTFGLQFLLTVTFPTGHLPGRPWRYAVLAILAVQAFVWASYQLSAGALTLNGDGGPHWFQNPLGFLPIPAASADGGNLAFLVLIPALGVGAASMVVRLSRATGIERAQLKWVVAAIVVVAGLWAGIAVSVTRSIDAEIVWALAGLAAPLPPIAVGFAVLRYRLYEIDRIVNRAVLYGTVTAILAGVFAAAIALTQRLFFEVTGQASDASVVLVTLAVAAAYAPVRKRVEAIVDRHLKYDDRRFGPYRDELRRLEELLAPDAAAARLAREAMVEMGARGAAVVGPGDEVIASAGTWPLDGVARVPIASAGTHPSWTAVLVGIPPSGTGDGGRRLDALAEVAALAARIARPD